MTVRKALLKTVTLSSVLLLGSNYAFAVEETTADPNETNTPVSGTLNLSANGGYNPNPPSSLNKKTEIGNSYFGISYVPETLNFQTTKLSDTIGTQEISLVKKKNGETYNIGVKDKHRQTQQNWTLTGKLSKNLSEENTGIHLEISSNRDVKRNMNDGDSEFKFEDLTEQVRKNGLDEVNETRKITLNTEAQTVMYNQGYFTNGVYDYEISNAKLVFPNVDKVKPQEISTTISWNLEQTPNKSESLVKSLKDLFEDDNYTKLKEFIPLEHVKKAEEDIKAIKNQVTKKINLEHFNRYVKGFFIQWDLKGSNNSRYNNTTKFIGSDTKKNALLRIFRANNKTTNDDNIGEKDYLNIKVIRDKDCIHEYSEKGNNNGSTTSYNNSEYVEETSKGLLIIWNNLQVGDIIEYTTHDPNNKLDVYPNDYKGSSTMKYVVTEQYKLEPTK